MTGRGSVDTVLRAFSEAGETTFTLVGKAGPVISATQDREANPLLSAPVSFKTVAAG